MIEIDVKLTGDIEQGLDAYGEQIKEKVLLSAAAAMANVVYDEVKINTSGLRKSGPGSPPGKVTGNLDRAIYRVFAKDKSDADTIVYKVSVNKAKAPHWHLIEFGTFKSPAYPYIRPAADKIPQAIDAGKSRIKYLLESGNPAGEAAT